MHLFLSETANIFYQTHIIKTYSAGYRNNFMVKIILKQYLKTSK